VTIRTLLLILGLYAHAARLLRVDLGTRAGRPTYRLIPRRGQHRTPAQPRTKPAMQAELEASPC
jgi:hypothetical protein